LPSLKNLQLLDLDDNNTDQVGREEIKAALKKTNPNLCIEF